MTNPNPRWTDHDLERFIDDDLEPGARAELADALRTDGALRARLGSIIDADATVRAALVDERAAAPIAGARRSRSMLPRGLAVAAALAALLLGGWWLARSGPARRPGPVADAPPIEPAGLSSAQTLAIARSSGLLIAISPGDAPYEARSVPPVVVASASKALLELLDRGDLDGALALLRDPPADADAEAWSALWLAFGQRLYSGQAAQEVLLSLPPARQVKVCRAWAGQPWLRPVTFEWLARLGASEDASVRAAVTALRADLGARPELRAWLRSYASAAGPGPLIP